ncbi:MAG: A/G-specific adenine glycosylase [Planctomycetia bacterium]|nr:A/G-specific adenine glycosylase [Planctomycetia bacterium]
MATKRTSPRSQSLAPPTAEWTKSFQRQLLGWYRRHKRDLPWRRTSDPYRIWISEIMLQQTQVATVVPYFIRFVAAFPTVRALAEADEHDVLRQWEGLGYYRRARQLHRAARVVVDQFGGQFPRDLDCVRRLPGIGRYTAGAIVSIAFDTPAPILEANTVRVFSRLIAFRESAAASAPEQRLWQLAEAVVPRRHCGAFNSALMELGSLVCTRRAPRCQDCPVSGLCAAFRSGEQDQIPRPRRKPRTEAVNEAAVVVRRGAKLLLRRRTADERWAGLWDFLRFPMVARRGAKLQKELVEKIERHSGLLVESPSHIATFKHGVTRFRITLDCYLAESADSKRKLTAGTWKWVRPEDLERFPLSVTGRKLGRLLVESQ